MTVKQIIAAIEDFAPPALQNDFDNSGLQVGNSSQKVRGILLCLDITPEALDEAIERDCNLIISHHPLLFKPLRSLTGKTYIERCLIKACKNDLVIYAAHTNLDNAWGGVNFHLAEKIGLQNVRFLKPNADELSAGGSGAIGELVAAEDEESFLERIKKIFRLKSLQHSPLTGKTIREVALCGGSGAFLIPDAIEAGADVFLTGEARYNDYYDVEDRLLLAVLGHYETEHYTKELFFDIISKKIPNFAIHFSNVNTNPVNYL
ncbi:MAG: Nif3-like dinuclear metal center hexameric protein [Dysgonamonadaceae bacterium]|jgi:dinuclear metal center YbgI/SA1388 family protein|nr:Nif3-like dinuclear metal center hexameric protein [Dysgonamonadaceae bacterium]